MHEPGTIHMSNTAQGGATRKCVLIRGTFSDSVRSGSHYAAAKETTGTLQGLPPPFLLLPVHS